MYGRLPDFVANAFPSFNFVVPVMFCDLFDQGIERELRLFNRHDDEFPGANGHIDRRVLVKLYLIGKGSWNPQGQTVAPLLHPCLHGGRYNEYTAKIPVHEKDRIGALSRVGGGTV